MAEAPKPVGFEQRIRGALFIVLISVVVVAPLVGAFVFSPLLVAGGIQPYPLAAALGVMIAETLAIAALAYLVLRVKK
jgi:hypothetical protein